MPTLPGPLAGHDRADDTAMLLDADLAILGAEPGAYQAYVNGVRAEYAHVDDGHWRTGRSLVLQHFLDRPRLFVTDYMYAAARAPGASQHRGGAGGAVASSAPND